MSVPIRNELVSQLMRSSGKRNTDSFKAGRDLSANIKSVRSNSSVSALTFICLSGVGYGKKLDCANPD